MGKQEVMQINFERIPLKSDRSFRAYEYPFLAQDQSFHIHQEYELAAVEGVDGVVYSGADTTNFDSGDLFLFGGRLPHRFTARRVGDHMAQHMTEEPMARVVQFRHDAFGPGFFHLPENAPILELLQASAAGLGFRRTETPGLEKELRNIVTSPGYRRLSLLLSLLADLAELLSSRSIRILSPGAPNFLSHDVDAVRLSRLQDYIEAEYKAKASIDGAAEKLALTRTSFCRYVKRITGRTFSELMNDYRLTVAAMLLRDSVFTISGISEEVGFGSLSHFNARFKERHGITPSAFRRSSGVED